MELYDRLNQINQDQGLDPYLLDIINGRTALPESSDPSTLLRRYSTVYDAYNAGNQQSKDAATYAKQIYGDLDNLYQYAYDTFRTTFGRDPSSTEFAQLLPAFGGTEGRQRGAAYVSSLFDQYKQSPEYLKTQAGQYSGQLNPYFDELLGRSARQDELDYYGQMLAGGRSPFEIRQILEASPEYQTAQDSKFRSGLASELEGYDLSFFDKAKENVISRSQRNNGGYGGSSALDFALTNLMGDIAEKRGGYLANISAQQYGGNKNAARDDYKSGMSRYFSEQDYDQRRRDSESDYYRSRSDEDRDYMRQRDDYNAYMNSQRQRSNPWGQFVGGAVGAGAGAYFGGPKGAQAGYNVGSGLGAGYDYLNY